MIPIFSLSQGRGPASSSKKIAQVPQNGKCEETLHGVRGPTGRLDLRDSPCPLASGWSLEEEVGFLFGVAEEEHRVTPQKTTDIHPSLSTTRGQILSESPSFLMESYSTPSSGSELLCLLLWRQNQPDLILD